MKIEIEKVLWMIDQSKYLETDDRHSDGFQAGIKTAHKSLKVQLEDYVERNTSRIQNEQRGKIK